MSIINNRLGVENKITDPANEYNGKIGIELRGSTSQSFPKKPYGFETWDDKGEDKDVTLLNMPKESDWTLNASYNDKSLMRDGLAYMFAGQIMDYAPRVRYVELMLNGQYQGVYMLIEKIKRDKNRVDIAKMDTTDDQGDDVTGGYIIKIDKKTGSNSGVGWTSLYKPLPNSWQTTYFQVEYPKSDDISDPQRTYIRDFFYKVENSIAAQDYKDPGTGYRKWVDTKSLIDFIIINELTKNPDAYRLSTFLHKQRDSDGGKLKFGPVWDFNLGFGNVDYCTQGSADGLVINTFNTVCPGDGWVIHFWWKKFLEDEALYNELKLRWKSLRADQFSDSRINFMVDSISTLLGQAQARNFQRWLVLGIYVWPNYFVGSSYASEVTWLRSWLKNRLTYLDKVWQLTNSNTEEGEELIFSVFPNPSSKSVVLNSNKELPSDLTFSIYDHSGKSYYAPHQKIDHQSFSIDISQLPSGLLILNTQINEKQYSIKILKE
ncbi:MAG: CotH kinase family protein, partial [Saprospiraceae bacterium]